MMTDVDTLILGGGVSGMAAAMELGDRAIVLEKDDRPGGLVRTDYVNGYWFDHVLHLLYFNDPKTQDRVMEFLGDYLAPCFPAAWVETEKGDMPFPFQMHLSGLDRDTIISCIHDLAEVTFNPTKKTASNFEEMLLLTFGQTMCDVFLFPYNRKMWKRPLNTLAPSGFQFTITPPDFDKVLRGALTPNADFRPYNDNGWYPQPPKDFPVRGMEVLSWGLAQQVKDLRLNHKVEEIDLERRVVRAKHNGETVEFRYHSGCCSTLPLPVTIQYCAQASEDLKADCRALKKNRVITAGFGIRGPRPQGRGLWRYFAQEDLCFSRLIHLHDFDPDSAPEDGWGLLAEITEPAESPLSERETYLERIRADLHKANALCSGEIVEEYLIIADPAYVVFTPESQFVVERGMNFLRDHGVEPLGRYGRWEYSSMANVIRDGMNWANSLKVPEESAA